MIKINHFYSSFLFGKRPLVFYKCTIVFFRNCSVLKVQRPKVLLVIVIFHWSSLINYVMIGSCTVRKKLISNHATFMRKFLSLNVDKNRDLLDHLQPLLVHVVIECPLLLNICCSAKPIDIIHGL